MYSSTVVFPDRACHPPMNGGTEMSSALSQSVVLIGQRTDLDDQSPELFISIHYVVLRQL